MAWPPVVLASPGLYMPGIIITWIELLAPSAAATPKEWVTTMISLSRAAICCATCTAVEPLPMSRTRASATCSTVAWAMRWRSARNRLWRSVASLVSVLSARTAPP